MINIDDFSRGGHNKERITFWIKKNSLFVTIITFVSLKLLIFLIFMGIFYLLNQPVWDNNYPRFHTGIDFFDLLGTRWDSNIYIPIAEEGYITINSPTDYRAWVFPPLYPFLIRLFVTVIPVDIHYTIAAVVVTNIFSVTTVVAFFYMSRIYLNELKAIIASLFFAFFPPVFVFSSVAYSEPVFLTFSIVSWYLYEKEKYASSGLFLSVATLARYEGALLFFIYGIIYVGRQIREKGFSKSMGSLIAIPLFPFILFLKIINLVWNFLISHSLRFSIIELIIKKIQKIIGTNQRIIENSVKLLEFLEIKLSWILVWGLIPFIWLIHIDNVAPLPINEIRRIFWGADITFPYGSFFNMLFTGNIKWALDKYSFVFLITLIGFFHLKKRPSHSLLILSQIFFYTSYIAAGWSIVRYTGSIFQIHVVFTDELSNNPKIYVLILLLLILYSFKVLWEFTHWSIWLI